MGAGTSYYSVLGILQGSDFTIQNKMNTELQFDKEILFLLHIPFACHGGAVEDGCTLVQGCMHNNGLSSPNRTSGSLLT